MGQLWKYAEKFDFRYVDYCLVLPDLIITLALVPIIVEGDYPGAFKMYVRLRQESRCLQCMKAT